VWKIKRQCQSETLSRSGGEGGLGPPVLGVADGARCLSFFGSLSLFRLSLTARKLYNAKASFEKLCQKREPRRVIHELFKIHTVRYFIKKRGGWNKKLPVYLSKWRPNYAKMSSFLGTSLTQCLPVFWQIYIEYLRYWSLCHVEDVILLLWAAIL
jgi:hypothetical protein